MSDVSRAARSRRSRRSIPVSRLDSAAGDLDVDWPAGERFADLEARVLAAFRDCRSARIVPP